MPDSEKPQDGEPNIKVELAKPGSKVGRIRLWGIEVELPRWALSLIAVLVVVAFGAYLYEKVGPPVLKKKLVELDLFTQFEEYQKHVTETPGVRTTLFKDTARGWLDVKYFDSDGCLEVTGQTPSHAIERFVQASVIEKAPGNTSGGRRSDTAGPAPSDTALAEANARMLFVSTPEVGVDSGSTKVPVQAGCQGRCMNPHPGNFNSWFGTRNGCFVQVWRQWPDRCTHYQWYNSCTGYWDSDMNGPRIYWTCCVH
ncbi:MAG TPA: hypothetical protein VN461_00800 [Vicinamibacteria bacterium]|jgi:hypothetical protein|nr:hypothetical protein [Vicinamibacteria bacterium]